MPDIVSGPMSEDAEKRGQIIRRLEEALTLAEAIDDGETAYLVGRALDAARARAFRLALTS